MPLLLLGVVRRGHPRPSPDREDVPGVRLVESADLAAAVCETEEQTELTEHDAARHLDVLIRLLRDGPVLPLAFGTVSPDEDSVRAEVLDAAADDLRTRLEAVDGLVEARLDISFDESSALREVLPQDPWLRGLAAEARGGHASLDARIALGEAVSHRLTEWRRTQADHLLPGLEVAAEDVAELESSEPLQQRWALLVRADALEPLDEAVGKARAALGDAAAIEYVGPLPVYSFLHRARAEEARPRSAWGW